MKLSHESKKRLAIGGGAIALILILIGSITTSHFKLWNNETGSTIMEWGDLGENGIEYASKVTVLSKATFGAEEIRSLDLDVESGSVSVKLVDGDTVAVIEKGRLAKGVRAEKATAKGLVKVEDQTLKVCGAKKSDKRACDRTALIEIPRALASELAAVHAVVDSDDLSLEHLTCKELDLNLGSGDFSYWGVVSDALDAQVGSGDAEFALDAAPATKMDTVVGSGDVYVEIPRDTGFSAELTLGSGDFDSDFLDDEVDGLETPSASFKNGDGAARYNFAIGSGDMTLNTRS